MQNILAAFKLLRMTNLALGGIVIFALIGASTLWDTFQQKHKSSVSPSDVIIDYHKLYAQLESSDYYASPVISARFLYSMNRLMQKVKNQFPPVNYNNELIGLKLNENSDGQADLPFFEVALNSALATHLGKLFENRTNGCHVSIGQKYSEFNQKLYKHFPSSHTILNIADSLGRRMANAEIDSFIPASYIQYPDLTFRDSIFIANSCNNASNGYQENWTGSLLRYQSELHLLNDIQTLIFSHGNNLWDSKTENHQEALEVYTLSRPLSKENKWIAEFWSDDHSGITFTPVTRWVSVLNQIWDREKRDYKSVSESYYLLSLALHETAVECWEQKYFYMIDRPEVYIKSHIDSTWQPFHDNPAFPGFPSGHSAFGAAACSVLEHFFGTSYSFTDFSHIGQKAFLSEPRSFKSFNEMAIENANSRLYLGVHYRKDCEAGFKLGKQVATSVLKWFSTESST